MLEIRLTPKFKRNYKKWIQKHPSLREKLWERIEIFSENPFDTSLKTHSLKNILEGLWSFSITYEYRLIFEFLNSEKTIVSFIDIGSHDEVY